MSLPVLNISDQKIIQNPDPGLDAKQLSQWVARLPVGDIGKASREIIKQLQTLNHSQYPVTQRMELMDILWPFTRQLIEILNQSLRYAPIPLKEKHLASAKILQLLREEMTYGYKLVIREQAVWDQRTPDNSLLQKALFYAVYHLTSRLMEAYIVYEPVPKGLWRELNQIYRYAESIGLHTALLAGNPMQSVEHYYKRALLMALTEPYKLMHKEAEEIYWLTQKWVPACKLLSLSENPNPGQCVLDLSLDLGPRMYSHGYTVSPHNGRIIDISEVNALLDIEIQQRLRHTGAETEQPNLIQRQHRDLLLRLADLWQYHATRQTKRINVDNNLHAAIGISACHHFIEHKKTFTPEMDALKLLMSTSAKPNEKEQKHVFMAAYRQALAEDQKQNHGKYATISWEQQDISSAGIAVNCNSSSFHGAKVGELVAYRTQKDCVRWQMGVVRWIKSKLQTGLDMGIMFLGSKPVPIATKALSGIGVDTGYFRALLLPQSASQQDIRSLIVPVWLYDVNTVLSVIMNNKLFYVRLTHLEMSTRSFSQFKFEVLDTLIAKPTIN